MNDFETRLISAIEEQRLVEVVRDLQVQDSLSAEDSVRLDHVGRCLEVLGRHVLDEASDLQTKLHSAGIDVRPTGVTKDELAERAPMVQVSSIGLEVDSSDSWDAYSALCPHGFQPWNELTESAWEAFRRTNSHSSLVRVSPHGYTTQLELSWEAGSFERVPNFLRPNERDFNSINLPKPLWPLYFFARAIRLVIDRLGRSSSVESIGPFLGTPSSLIGPLLDLAHTGPDDVVYDIGCGDGRILIEAALRGSRGTGIELRPDLIELARENAAEAGVEDRLDFIEGDASSVDTAHATVVFLFLPVAVTAAMVASFRESARPGTRVIAHEQEALPSDIGSERHALITEGGVTIAHLWEMTDRKATSP
ncbi:MAG: hypothetical protein ACI81L_002334 [Verrucomicrobiales bacterium]|jgi:hypothetical protein